MTIKLGNDRSDIQKDFDTRVGLDVLETNPFASEAIELAEAISYEAGIQSNAVRILPILSRIIGDALEASKKGIKA
jgi:hypothetical protein